MVEYFQKGGPIMYPLLVFSIVALGLILERFFYYLRLRVNVHQWFDSFAKNRQVGDEEIEAQLEKLQKHPLRRIFKAIWVDKNLSRKDLEALAQEEVEEQVEDLEKNLKPLSVIAILSPLLGLLGTVLGIMNAFEKVYSVKKLDQIQLAGGIWEALITTFTGLCIALPIWMAYHYFISRVERQVFLMEFFSSRFIRSLHQRGFLND